MPQDFIKGPNDVLDYKFDFRALTNANSPEAESDYLESGETIDSRTVTVSSGITKDSDALADTNSSVLVWLSGGTPGSRYTVTCEVVTSGGRTLEREIFVDVR